MFSPNPKPNPFGFRMSNTRITHLKGLDYEYKLIIRKRLSILFLVSQKFKVLYIKFREVYNSISLSPQKR